MHHACEPNISCDWTSAGRWERLNGPISMILFPINHGLLYKLSDYDQSYALKTARPVGT